MENPLKTLGGVAIITLVAPIFLALLVLAGVIYPLLSLTNAAIGYAFHLLT